MRKFLWLAVLYSFLFSGVITGQETPAEEKKEPDPLEHLNFGPVGPNLTLEQVSEEFKFLPGYFQDARNRNKPVIFCWQYRGRYHEETMSQLEGNKNLAKMADIRDISAYYPEEESDERSDLRRTLCKFSGNSSLYSESWGTRIITPSGEFLSFDGSDLERQIPLFYTMACDRKLRRDRDYVLYETIANTIRPRTREQFVRSKYIRKSVFPDPVGQYVSYAMKKDSFVFLYIGNYGKKEVRDMKVKEQELSERLPGVTVKVLSGDGDVLPSLFDVIYSEMGTRKYGMLIAPEGVKWMGSWTPSVTGPAFKLHRDAQNFIAAGKYEKALQYMDTASLFFPEGYVYGDSLKRSLTNIREALRKKLGIEEPEKTAVGEAAAGTEQEPAGQQKKRPFDDTIVFKNDYPIPFSSVTDRGKFLSGYMTSARRVRKPLVFIMAPNIRRDFLEDKMNDKRFQKYGIYQDAAPDMENTDLDHRFFADLIAKYAFPDSIYFGNYTPGFIVFPDQKTIHGFYCYPYSRNWGAFIQIALYLEAYNMKLNGNNEYRRFQELALDAYVDEDNGMYVTRKGMIKDLTLPSNLNELVQRAQKDKNYHLEKISILKRDQEEDLKTLRIEMKKSFPSFRTYAVPVQVSTRPVLFNRRGDVVIKEGDDINDIRAEEELAVLIGPEGILACSPWYHFFNNRGGFRIFYNKTLKALEKGDTEAALRFLKFCDELIPGKGDSSWADAAVKDIKKLSAVISGDDLKAGRRNPESDRPVIAPEPNKGRPASKPKEEVETF